MNGAEKIKNKILEEAKQESDNILEEAKTQEEKINNQNKNSEKEYASNRRNDVQKSVKLYKDKTLAQSRLKVRRIYLGEREKIVEDFLQEALKSISHSSKEYSTFLKNIIDKSMKQLSGDITIYCSKADKTLAKKLTPNATIEISKISGGLIFEDSSGKRIDESISSKVERIKDKLRENIVKSIEK